jgi:NADH-quinone oxidoreductase subunit L
MSVEALILIILGAPLLGVILNTLGYQPLRRPVPGWIGTLMVAVSAVASWGLVAVYRQPVDWILYQWIDTALFQLTIGFHVDWLTVLMLVVVSTVSACVHLYSIEYMEEDEGFNRFFIYLNLFVFAMFVLVTARNLPMMFIGWEGVGLCSYLLIGFWYRRESARAAGQKAFIVNRLGDFCFLLGMFLTLKYFGTFSFVGLEQAAGGAPATQLWTIGLLLFGGAVGKSAQFPLYVWLPDAMEGPTPVSSLIHAATMVTAGVYLVARLDFVYSAVPSVGHSIAAVGAFTALFAATVATVHEDMKRILAFSTISQLGYMFVGVGMGAYGAGMFHLITHAFFKGLLFLMAGSVMHALHGELNIFRMDKLWDQLPLTGTMAIVGGLGLSGFPLISGFWSKDEILLASLGDGQPFEWTLFVILAVAALLTAFYTFRMVFVAFFASAREAGDYDENDVHDCGWKMALPMVLLAVVTVVGYFFSGWTAELSHGHHGGHGFHTIVMSVSVAVSLGGILLAYLEYLSDVSIIPSWDGLHDTVRQQYFVEELYNTIIVNPLWTGSKTLWMVFDDLVIDGIVNLTGAIVDISGLVLRFVQTGYIRHYLVIMTTAISLLISLLALVWLGV